MEGEQRIAGLRKGGCVEKRKRLEIYTTHENEKGQIKKKKTISKKAPK